MKSQRRFGWWLVALLVVALSAVGVLAQDESQDSPPSMQYPKLQNVPTQYPDQGSNAPAEQYPNAQQYPEFRKQRSRSDPRSSGTRGAPAVHVG